MPTSPAAFSIFADGDSCAQPGDAISIDEEELSADHDLVATNTSATAKTITSLQKDDKDVNSPYTPRTAERPLQLQSVQPTQGTVSATAMNEARATTEAFISHTRASNHAVEGNSQPTTATVHARDASSFSPTPSFQLPHGRCNFVDLSSGISGTRCGCRRFWAYPAQQTTSASTTQRQHDPSSEGDRMDISSPGNEREITNLSALHCVCSHHACFHDHNYVETSQSSKDETVYQSTERKSGVSGHKGRNTSASSELGRRKSTDDIPVDTSTELRKALPLLRRASSLITKTSSPTSVPNILRKPLSPIVDPTTHHGKSQPKQQQQQIPRSQLSNPILFTVHDSTIITPNSDHILPSMPSLHHQHGIESMSLPDTLSWGGGTFAGGNQSPSRSMMPPPPLQLGRYSQNPNTGTVEEVSLQSTQRFESTPENPKFAVAKLATTKAVGTEEHNGFGEQRKIHPPPLTSAARPSEPLNETIRQLQRQESSHTSPFSASSHASPQAVGSLSSSSSSLRAIGGATRQALRNITDTISEHDRRLNKVETIAMAPNHGNCDHRHNESETQLSMLEKRLRLLEEQIRSAEAKNTEMTKTYEQNLGEQRARDDTEKAVLLAQVERMQSQLTQLRSWIPSSSQPWKIEVVLLPFLLRKVWQDIDEFKGPVHRGTTSEFHAGRGSPNADDWTRFPIPGLEGAHMLYDMKADRDINQPWLSARACKAESVIDKRLRSRGLIRTIVVTGGEARAVQEAMEESFGSILHTLIPPAQRKLRTSQRYLQFFGLQQDWIPLRKVHKDSRLRFLSPSEMVTPALWDVSFMQSVMMKSATPRLFITQPEAYIQDRHAYKCGWSWKQVHDLRSFKETKKVQKVDGEMDTDTDNDHQDQEERDMEEEEFWRWNELLDEPVHLPFLSPLPSEDTPVPSPQLAPITLPFYHHRVSLPIKATSNSVTGGAVPSPLSQSSSQLAYEDRDAQSATKAFQGPNTETPSHPHLPNHTKMNHLAPHNLESQPPKSSLCLPPPPPPPPPGPQFSSHPPSSSSTANVRRRVPSHGSDRSTSTHSRSNVSSNTTPSTHGQAYLPPKAMPSSHAHHQPLHSNQIQQQQQQQQQHQNYTYDHIQPHYMQFPFVVLPQHQQQQYRQHWQHQVPQAYTNRPLELNRSNSNSSKRQRTHSPSLSGGVSRLTPRRSSASSPSSQTHQQIQTAPQQYPPHLQAYQYTMGIGQAASLAYATPPQQASNTSDRTDGDAILSEEEEYSDSDDESWHGDDDDVGDNEHAEIDSDHQDSYEKGDHDNRRKEGASSKERRLAKKDRKRDKENAKRRENERGKNKDKERSWGKEKERDEEGSRGGSRRKSKLKRYEGYGRGDKGRKSQYKSAHGQSTSKKRKRRAESEGHSSADTDVIDENNGSRRHRTASNTMSGQNQQELPSLSRQPSQKRRSRGKASPSLGQATYLSDSDLDDIDDDSFVMYAQSRQAPQTRLAEGENEPFDTHRDEMDDEHDEDGLEEDSIYLDENDVYDFPRSSLQATPSASFMSMLGKQSHSHSTPPPHPPIPPAQRPTSSEHPRLSSSSSGNLNSSMYVSARQEPSLSSSLSTVLFNNSMGHHNSPLPQRHKGSSSSYPKSHAGQDSCENMIGGASNQRAVGKAGGSSATVVEPQFLHKTSNPEDEPWPGIEDDMDPSFARLVVSDGENIDPKALVDAAKRGSAPHAKKKKKRGKRRKSKEGRERSKAKDKGTLGTTEDASLQGNGYLERHLNHHLPPQPSRSRPSTQVGLVDDVDDVEDDDDDDDDYSVYDEVNDTSSDSGSGDDGSSDNGSTVETPSPSTFAILEDGT